jgi:hypothetical protein
MTVSFEKEITPLFRPDDVEIMKGFGMDLSSHWDVSARADDILERLKAGDMPCDGAWEEDKIALFQRWLDEGKGA